MKPQHAMISLLLVLVMMASAVPQNAAAASLDSNDTFGPELQVYEVDSFVYRASFKLSDGTEILLVRSTFSIYYLFHPLPRVAEHYVSAFIGFYYGKTMLGRSIVSEVVIEEVAFYPKWSDIAGSNHDLLFGAPIFVLSESIADKELARGTILIDESPLSRYVQQFGGTLVFTGLKFVLEDGREITLSDDSIQIVLEKHYNDFLPREATLTGEDNVTYLSDENSINFTAQGSAPLLALLDLILAYTMMGLGVAIVIPGILHFKGRITLSTARLRRFTSYGPSDAQ